MRPGLRQDNRDPGRRRLTKVDRYGNILLVEGFSEAHQGEDWLKLSQTAWRAWVPVLCLIGGATSSGQHFHWKKGRKSDKT